MKLINEISSNLARLREKRGLTISGLAQRCGIAKSTLSSLESGQGNPTIETLWAIANALDVPFGSLLPNDPQTKPDLGDGKIVVRFIERTVSDDGASIETYNMTIEQGHTKESTAHPSGVREKVVVTSGPMLVGALQSPKLVNTGDVYAFEADVPHIYGAPSGPVHAMVFVEYPAARMYCSQLHDVLDWPVKTSDWDGARSIFERMCIEVSNGIAMRMLRLRGCPESSTRVLETLSVELFKGLAGQYRWPVLTITEIDQEGPFVAVLPQHFARAFLGTGDLPGTAPLAARALMLAEIAETNLLPRGEPITIHQSMHKSWTLETLASECALLEGNIRLPEQLLHMADRNHGVASSNEEEAFSSRIQVEHYDAFELLHPAYARQVVAMAQDITAFLPDALTVPLQTIDVGTGPGVPLLMLHELLPELRFLAVEPDPVAYACLQINTQDKTGIVLHQGGFLELECETDQARLITSVGASHHFNTAFMLQKAMRLLQPGGVLSVADEFLPPFHDIESRNLALVLHHASYILETASMIESSGQTVPDDADGELYRAFRRYLVLAVLHAQQGQALQSMRLCRQLYTHARQAALDKHWDHAVGAYTRFFWLELQAMVAGFDYEVERKTHVRRFQELAVAAGFELLRHRRVYATHGADERDGGTHVMTLRRPLL